VLMMRTLDDALKLRALVSGGGKRVVVIGAGFIGLEVAATVRQLGNEVTVLEGLPAPLIRGLGAEIGAAVGEVHIDKGVDLRCGVRIASVANDGVMLDDGESIPADVIVVGIGVAPATEWLEGSGLELRDGVVCDATLCAGPPGIYAAGDLVRWHNTLFDEEMRVEHWTNAAEQGALAATNLIAESKGEPTQPYSAVPFFWSDQFEHRLSFLGRSSEHDEVRIVSGSVAARQFIALYRRGERLHGAFGLNSNRPLMAYRKLLQQRIGWDAALEHAASV
jgi:NADPH-dependent 2,4-dienoyl-CoA reductase/sulfur reductase-like enzyme